jgi:hypothetical protein
MNLDVLIDALMDNVKDADARSNIYRAILEACDYTERDGLEECTGIDLAFDKVAEDFMEDEDDEDEYEEDFDYDEE